MPSFYNLVIQPAFVGHGMWVSYREFRKIAPALANREQSVGEVIRIYAMYPLFIAGGYGVMWYRRVWQPLQRWWNQ